MSIQINRLEEGYNSYPLVCRRPAETVSLQRRQIYVIDEELQHTDHLFLGVGLYHLGIQDKHWTLIQNLHSNATTSVKWNGHISDRFNIQQGLVLLYISEWSQ
jgi:hypothetical protein